MSGKGGDGKVARGRGGFLERESGDGGCYVGRGKGGFLNV